jgi:hypothetical protein
MYRRLVMVRKLNLRDWITYTQAARELNLSVSSVRVYALKGILTKAYVGGEHPMVSVASVEAYKKHRSPPGNPNYRYQPKEESAT